MTENLSDLGLAPLTVGRPPLAVLVDAAAWAGFARVGVTLWVPGRDLVPECSDSAVLRESARMVAGSGVRVLDAGVVVLRPELRREDLLHFLGAAQALGADRVIALNDDPLLSRAAGTLAAVCDDAAAAGMSVGVEPMPYSATRTISAACQLLDAADLPNGGLVVDALHLHRSGGTAADVAATADRVLLAQLCDARPGAPSPSRLREEALGDRLYPGEGALPLGELLAVLVPGVPLTVESPVAADATRSARERASRAATAARRLLRSPP